MIMEDMKIPAKTKSSATEVLEEGDLKKQIGCMNGILQLFDRHRFITGRRVTSHNHKRLLQGAWRRQGTLNMEKGPEVPREKPRMSTESSRASCSSSTCSTSTFSSLDCNRTSQPEALPQIQISIQKEQPPLTKSMRSLDLRDIVKDSMHREARSLCIKHPATDERRGTVMKHIDSPRPSQHFKPGKPKATDCKEERLAPRRFSYDGRDLKETSKWGMKYKELPRLSLDSKSTSLNSSASESKLKFPVQHQSCQPLASNQEGHHRSSSIVAKLMGLEALQQTNFSEESRTQALSSCSKGAFLSTSSAEQNRQNQDNSPCVSKSNPAATSPRLHNASYAREPITCSKLPPERAPWRQQDRSQGRKAASTSHISSSVYGEIEKRITELEFQQSGKDLRALRQILEAMEKTRERLETQQGKSAEFTFPGECYVEENYSAETSKLSMSKNAQSYHRGCTNKGPCMPKKLSSSNLSMKEAKMMDKVNLSRQAPTTEILQPQRLQTRVPTYHRAISARKEKVDNSLKNNNVIDPNQHLPSPQKKTTWSYSEVNQPLAGPHCMNSARSFEIEKPRIQQNPITLEEQSYPSIPLLDSHRFRKQCIKKFTEKSSNNRKHKGRARDLHLTDDQLSELSNKTRCTSSQGDIASVQSECNSQLSQSETGFVSPTNSINANARQREISGPTRRKNKPTAENAGNLLEQPSPNSVLECTFYNEDSPSPVKRTSTNFRDESSSSSEVYWDLKNPNHSAACRKSDCDCKYNQKLKNMKHSASELGFMDTEPDKIVGSDNAFANGGRNRDHRYYITKILLTSGLLRDSNFFSMTDQILPSCHLINPDIFHVLEQTEEDIMDFTEITKNNDTLQLNKKLQRRIIFDVVDEILVRKIHKGRYTVGNKSTSPQRLSKEVYLEMDRLCRISDCNFDNMSGVMTSLLSAHVLYPYEDWADYSSELPDLVLDIERQIFKDLIEEVITVEVMSFHNRWKRPCRKLFSY